MEYRPEDHELEYDPNDELTDEVNKELKTVYRRMNFIVRLYNGALLRIVALEKENSELKKAQEFQGRDIDLIKETLGGIAKNTEWTRRMITQALVVAGIGAVSAFVMFLVQRGF